MPPDLKVRATLPAGPQIRSYPAQFEVRMMDGNKAELRGYASTTETPYEMFDMFGAYTEVVRTGAFAKTLAESADVAFLTNHEGLTMARTKSGSLKLAEDSTGLETVATMNTSRTDVRDLMAAVDDGDVDEMSFAFRMIRQQWSPDYDERALIEINLNKGDVSAVNYGANSTTSLGVQRSFRSRHGANLHRIATELREGKALSSSTMNTLSQVLDLIASADDAVDEAQPLLADLLDVPNPDEPDAARALAYLETLRRRHEHDAV